MIRIVFGLFLSAVSLFSLPAKAQQGGDILDARILTGWQRADGKHIAALHINLNDGWKTYWRAPGDAGIPPQFIWSQSRNLSNVEVSWPTPKRLLQNGIETIGYEHAVTLPLTITPKQKGASIKLAGKVVLGVCKDVCVPMTLELSQDLPVDHTKPDPRIVAALADRPYSAKEANVGRVACRVTPISDGLHLRAEMSMPKTGGSELAVVESDNPMLWVVQTETSRQGTRLIAEADFYHVEGHSFALNRSGIRITVLGRDLAVEVQGCPAG